MLGLVCSLFLPTLLCCAEPEKQAAPSPNVLLAAERNDGQTGAAPLPPILAPEAFHYQALRGFAPATAAFYKFTLPVSGRASVWLRYSAKAPASTAFSLNTTAAGARIGLPGTAEFRWTRLGDVECAAGPQTLYLFGGAFQADALWVGEPGRTPPESAPPVIRERKTLPPLEHAGVITQHPRWLYDTVRVAYAHWEREKPMPFDAWARTMKARGATALLALGNVPDTPQTHAPGREEKNAAVPPAGWKPDYGWVKEYTEIAHRHGLRLTIYSEQLGHLDELLAEHPDWREKNEAGENHGKQPCFSSPYWPRFVERVVEFARTGADGLMMDMLGFGNPGGCRNPHCLRAFEEKFGVPAPTYVDPKDPVYQRWIDFQCYVREEALLRLTQAVHAVNPDFAIMVNQHRGWHFHIAAGTFLSSRLHECIDGIFEEIGWEDRHVLTLNRPLAFPMHDSFQNAFLRSRQGTGRALQWYLTAASPEVELKARNFNMLAHGVIPAPLTGPPLEWRYELWNDIREREEGVLGCQALPWLGILYSENTDAWRYAALDEDRAARPYVESVWGAFQVAAEERCPTDILCDWQLTPDNLKRYRAIVLPNAAALSQGRVDALREYVRQGGGLIATYETSLCDETAQPRADFGLADVFGVSWRHSGRAQGIELSLRDSRHEIARDEVFRWMGDWRQGADQPLPFFKLTTGRPEMQIDFAVTGAPAAGVSAEGRLSLYAPMGALFTPEQKLTGENMPAFVAREYGAGRVVYIPADITRAYFMKNSAATQALLARSIRWVARGAPPIEIVSNFHVEATYFQKGSTLYVHLLNDVGGFGRASPPNPESYGYRKDIVPMIDLPVWLNRPVKRARLLPGNRELPLQTEGGRTKVVVPRLDLHAVLALESD